MSRLFLTWIGLAILGLGTPRDAGAAELRPGGVSASVVPRSERPSSDALAPDRFRGDAVQVAHVGPFAPAPSPRLPGASASGGLPAGAPSRTALAALHHVLPDARAPPA